ncbi:uncharacterized protein [Venturia canescens]|uniref:uncharacterized protein isoform X2 n=1 Tax=Venturia canescens TaxID=32260 RepID=UPI001C9BD017|nr:uncharacterized protein LOC122410955 isoform X2 [Venturia canescens]
MCCLELSEWARSRQRGATTQLSASSFYVCCTKKVSDGLLKLSRALRRNLTAKDVVCKLHFSPDSVLKEYATAMPDGTIHCIPCGNYGLAKDAVPMAIENQKSVEAIIGAVPEETMEVMESSAEGLDGVDGLDEAERLYSAELVALEDEFIESTIGVSIDDIIAHFEQQPLQKTWSWIYKLQDDP